METNRRHGIDFKAAKILLDQKKKEKSDTGRGGLGDVRWMRMPDTGELKIRFLPPVIGEPVPGMIIHKHYNLPAHEVIKGNITCLKTWGLECPICNVLDEYKDRANLNDFSGTSAYFNVLVLDHRECDPSLPYLLQTSGYTYEWLLQQVLNSEVGDITDVEEGANVTFLRKKKKGAFERIISRKSSPIADTSEGIDRILGEMYDMRKIWRDPDDNYFNIAEEQAVKLRDIIEERFIELINKDDDKNKPVREVQEAKRKVAESDSGLRRTSREEDEEAKRIREEKELQAQHAQRALKLEEEEKKKEEAPVVSSRRRTVRDEEEAPPQKKEEVDTGSSLKKSSNKKAPECFGVEHSDTERRCQICSYEYDCNVQQLINLK